jgi:hypothetical protein
LSRFASLGVQQVSRMLRAADTKRSADVTFVPLRHILPSIDGLEQNRASRQVIRIILLSCAISVGAILFGPGPFATPPSPTKYVRNCFTITSFHAQPGSSCSSSKRKCPGTYYPTFFVSSLDLSLTPVLWRGTTRRLSLRSRVELPFEITSMSAACV